MAQSSNALEQIDEVLDKMTKRQLELICKKLRYSGYSKFNKRELLTFIKQKKDKESIYRILIEEKYISKPKKKYLFTKLIPLTAGSLTILLFLGNLYNAHIDKRVSEIIKKEESESYFKGQDEKFKILIAPFSKLHECELENTSYASALLGRYNSLADSLNIVAEVYKSGCITDRKSAISKGMLHQADLIIWGEYDADCELGTQVKIGHYLFKEFNISSRLKQSESNFKFIQRITDLRDGYLQENIDKIILISNAIALLNQGYYNDSYTLLTSSLYKNDVDIKRYIAFNSLKKSNFSKAIEIYDEIISSYKDKDNMLINRAIAKLELNQHSSALSDLNLVNRKLDERMLWNKSLALFNLGQFNKSINELNTLISLKKEWHYFHQRANCLNNTGRINEAITDYSRSIKTKDNFYSRINRSALYRKQGKYKEALRDIIESYKFNESKDVTNTELALWYYHLNKYHLALPLLTTLHKNDVDNEVIFDALINCLNKLGKYSLTAKYFTPKYNTSDASKHNYAIALRHLGRTKEALKIVNELLLKKDNRYFDYLYTKAKIISNHGNYEESISIYKKILKANPQHSYALTSLGYCYAQLGQYSKAIKAFQNSFTADQTNITALQNLSVIKNVIGENNFQLITKESSYNTRLLKEHIDSLLFHENNIVENYILKAKLLRFENNYHQSNSSLFKALERSKYNIEIYKLIASNFESLNKVDSALIHINYALEISKNDSECLERKMKYLGNLGHTTEALNLISTLESINKNKYYAYFLEGQYWASIGEKEKAIKAYKNSIELNPNYSHTLNNLAHELRLKKSTQESLKMADLSIVANRNNCYSYTTKAEAMADLNMIDSFYYYTEKALKEGCQVWNFKLEVYNQFKEEKKFNNLISKYRNE